MRKVRISNHRILIILQFPFPLPTPHALSLTYNTHTHPSPCPYLSLPSNLLPRTNHINKVPYASFGQRKKANLPSPKEKYVRDEFSVSATRCFLPSILTRLTYTKPKIRLEKLNT